MYHLVCHQLYIALYVSIHQYDGLILVGIEILVVTAIFVTPFQQNHHFSFSSRVHFWIEIIVYGHSLCRNLVIGCKECLGFLFLFDECLYIGYLLPSWVFIPDVHPFLKFGFDEYLAASIFEFDRTEGLILL